MLPDGNCPGCHQNLMIAQPGRNYVECAICGRKGYISLDENGNLQYTWPEDNQDRLTMMGKYDHLREIKYHTEAIYNPQKDSIQEELERYKQYESCVVRR